MKPRQPKRIYPPKRSKCTTTEEYLNEYSKYFYDDSVLKFYKRLESHQANFNNRYFISGTFNRPVLEPADVSTFIKIYRGRIVRELYNNDVQCDMKFIFVIERHKLKYINDYRHHWHAIITKPRKPSKNPYSRKFRLKYGSFQNFLRHKAESIRRISPTCSSGTGDIDIRDVDDPKNLFGYLMKELDPQIPQSLGIDWLNSDLRNNFKEALQHLVINGF